ncbi:MAG TPA: hypothetical protein PK544_00205 [Spirochaetota bacterium]|nr:hypothetical protein [Spirochaetota bacterium]HPJ37483.1 hypothetical protein [Spirochaetota bacterium]HPQ51848.1 hypothetical protein [Spirochaetota bacterium]
MNGIRCLFIPILFCCCINISGCTKHEALSFCEGVNPKGEGVRCGTKFTTGDLTAVVALQETADIDGLKLVVLKKTQFKSEAISTLKLQTGAEKKAATATLSLYNEGTYTVRVIGKNNSVIAEKSLTIIDTY